MKLIALIYKKIINFRNLMYDKNQFMSYKSRIPVVSVGNITVGGTGKTPFVIFLVAFLKNKGLNPLIISRGYGRKTRGQIFFNSNIKKTIEEVGDEPFLISLLCKDTDIIINKNRVEAAKWAENKTRKYDVIILDDGFQHRALKRDFDILLINANQNLSSCLPYGRLREPLKNINRATCLVFTKSSSLNSAPKIITESNIPIFKSKESFKPSNLNYQPGVAFSGIGDPESFISTLRGLSMKTIDTICFKDHQKYDDLCIGKIEKMLKKNNTKNFITTQKDWIKLPSSFLKKYNGTYIEMSLSIDDFNFQNLLMEKIR